MAGRKRGTSLEERLAAIRTAPADEEAPALDGPSAPQAEFTRPSELEPRSEINHPEPLAEAEPFARSESFHKFAALESAIVGELAEILETPADAEVPDASEGPEPPEPYEFFDEPEPVDAELVEAELVEAPALEVPEPVAPVSPVSFFAPAETDAVPQTEAPAESEPVAETEAAPEVEAAPERFESAGSFFSFGSIASQTAGEQRDPESAGADAATSARSRFSFAAEGDTFLPGSVAPPRVDLGVAQPAEAGPQSPAVHAPAPPAEIASAPETPRLSKLRRGWGRRAQDRREVPAELPAEPVVEHSVEEVAEYAPSPVDAPVVEEIAPVSEMSEIEAVETEPATVEPETVEPETVEPETVEPETVAAEVESEPTTAEVNEVDEIIAEIAEIAEVAEIAEIAEVTPPSAPAPAWVPVRGRVPKPRPFRKREATTGVPEVTDAVVDEVAEPEAVTFAPDPVVDGFEAPVDEQLVDEPVVEEVAVVEEDAVVEAEREVDVEVAVEPEVVEPEVAAEPEPIVEAVVEETVAEPEPEPVVVEPAPVPEFAASEQAQVDELVAEAEFVEAVGAAVDQKAGEADHTETDDQSPWTRRVRTERFGRIGTTLIERGLITNEQLDEALEIQRTSGRRVGDILVELGALSSFELARVLADHMGVPFTDLRTKPPDPIIAALLPEDVARRYDALAIQRWNEQLVVAMANPTDLFALDDLQMVTRQPIIAAMAVKEDLRAAIDRVYRVSIVETVESAKVDYSAEVEAATLNVDDVDEGPIVGLVNALMGQAITDKASDLHIEPNSSHIAIRMRIDGVLHDASTVPLELLRPVVSRVKILAGLDIAQTRLAQDGRFSLTIDGRSVDVRVVTMPTAAGEAVILRLLDPIRDALGVTSLGLSPEEYARFIPAFTASQGAVFIAGPTGSGKTSTIYAVLSEVNTRTKSIVSVENPVEFRLDGIKQMQINARAGLTFPTALPTVLRSDPDVVFIGEVRDTDTARIAADAAITGHLVLSTLHATRAASAPMRLVEMGVEPYLVASALTLVASQRLARKLCEHCSEPADEATMDQLRGLGALDSELQDATVRRAVGCPACRGTGYRGRLPIFEIMPVTEGISRLILERASRAQIEDLAVEEGMDTMLRAAIKRVVRGDLSVEEMLRVVS